MRTKANTFHRRVSRPNSRRGSGDRKNIFNTARKSGRQDWRVFSLRGGPTEWTPHVEPSNSNEHPLAILRPPADWSGAAGVAKTLSELGQFRNTTWLPAALFGRLDELATVAAQEAQSVSDKPRRSRVRDYPLWAALAAEPRSDDPELDRLVQLVGVASVLMPAMGLVGMMARKGSPKNFAASWRTHGTRSRTASYPSFSSKARKRSGSPPPCSFAFVFHAFLAIDADDVSMGSAVLSALAASRFLSPSEAAIFIRAEMNSRWSGWVSKMLLATGLRTERALFKSMALCEISMKEGLVSFSPTAKRRGTAWEGIGSEQRVQVPIAAGPLAMASALREAFSRCSPEIAVGAQPALQADGPASGGSAA